MALAVAAPAVVGASLSAGALGLDGGSNWVFAFYAVVVVGLLAGARGAARRSGSRAPLLHSTLAALTAFGLIAAAGAAARLLAGGGVEPAALLFNALVALSAGLLGGLSAALPAGKGPTAPSRDRSA